MKHAVLFLLAVTVAGGCNAQPKPLKTTAPTKITVQATSHNRAARVNALLTQNKNKPLTQAQRHEVAAYVDSLYIAHIKKP